MVGRFWLVPDDGDVAGLVRRLRRAGHRNVAVGDGGLFLVPFEEPPEFAVWAAGVMAHFGCSVEQVV